MKPEFQTDTVKLTADQIKNWRNVLFGMIGPWALMMPDNEVQLLHDEMQRRFGVTPAHNQRKEMTE